MRRSDETRSRARDRVLVRLKTRGPQQASALARSLDVTPMAVRQHLAALQEEGLVEHREERRGVGRPTRIWKLSSAAASRFPDSHADLVVDLLGSMRRTFGAEGLDRLVTARSRQQLRSYRELMPTDEPKLAKRVAALAAIRRDEGYMAEWSKSADGSFLLVENHCPICAAAEICQGLCRDELELFRKVLGRDATVERTEHLLAGARRCVYRIAPRAAARRSAKVQRRAQGH